MNMAGAGRGPALHRGCATNAAHFDQVEAQRPDPLKHAMQACLVELAPDQGDAAGGCHAQACECARGGTVEVTRDADLVAHQHKRSASYDAG